MSNIRQEISDILYVYNITGSLVDYEHIPEIHRGALLYPHMFTPFEMSENEEVRKQKRLEYLKEHFKPSEAAIEKADLLLKQKET